MITLRSRKLRSLRPCAVAAVMGILLDAEVCFESQKRYSMTAGVIRILASIEVKIC